MEHTTASQKRIVVIGAGAAGILAGIKLREMGQTDFVILEKGPALGGTWRDNRYPGVACDIPAHYYCYSFEPNADPKNVFATGRELWNYFARVTRKYFVDQHIQYGVEVVDAKWDGSRWALTSRKGERFNADIVISAVGRLHRPQIPGFEGVESFNGVVRHSSQWDPSTNLHGRRVGVIGTGSSAVQIVSAVAREASHLTLFQRTAQWVMPMKNTPVPFWKRAALRLLPRYQRKVFQDLAEWMAGVGGEIALGGVTETSLERDRLCRDYLATVRDDELRRKLTPDHEVGCKRLVINGEFYESVQRDNVDVITSPIDRFEPTGVRAADGTLHELDVVLLATGFQADSYLRPMTVTGEGGVTLDEIWKDLFLSYKSVALPHMPNFFTINGPFSPGGSNSILAVIENHVHYVMKLVSRVVDEDIALAPDPVRTSALIDEIRERGKKTVWYTGGCDSWYLGKDGVPLVNPLGLRDLELDLAQPDYADFVVTGLAVTGSGAGCSKPEPVHRQSVRTAPGVRSAREGRR